MYTDQIEIVLQYLKIETNYAIIINGQYGVGKTHFYKQELAPKIREVSLSKNESKKYTPIHISLFGFKSLEDIQTAIFVELFPILKSKNLKLAAGIGKSLIRGIAQIGQAGDIDKYIGDINQDADDWLKYDELVICFDDIDRKSSSLDLKDVFGFINSLVENQGAKILIVANEEQLLIDENYSSVLREKVIGVTIQYKPDPLEVYKQIITARYSASWKLYFDFLSENNIDIIQIIEKNNNNFRNLIFFLEHFKTIFYPVEQLFQDEKDFAILKTEKLKAILDFSLAITIEYKLGLLNSTNLGDVENVDKIKGIIDLKKLLETSNDTNTNTNIKYSYIELFREKYFKNTKYYFFKSIFEYITGIKAFRVTDLKTELEGYFIVKDGGIPRQEQLLKDLDYSNCLKLTDKEYRSLTSEMLSFVKNGQYQLRQYATVFHFATRFNNLLNFDFIKLKKLFKNGIEKGKSNYTYNADLRFILTVSNDTEFRDDVKEIIQICFEINNSLSEAAIEDETNQLFRLFFSDYDAFYTKITTDQELRYTPFWSEFNIKKVYQRINKLLNQHIWVLGSYFTNRYRSTVFESLYPEKEFIINLLSFIDKSSTTRSMKNLHNTSLDHLSKCLSESLSNFPT